METRRHPRRVYKRPPLEEARLAVYFQGGRQTLLPGLLAASLGKQLPNIELINKDVEIDQGSGDVRWGPDHQFSNRTRNLAVLLGSGYFALVAQRPYVGFNEFMDFVRPTWSKFVEAATGVELVQIRLSYYNVIEIPDSEQNLAHFLNGGFFISPKVMITNWPIEHSKSDALFRLTETMSARLTSAVTGGEKPFITLNLEAISHEITPGGVASWCQGAHDILADLFEDFCTDELKNTFEPLEDQEP